MFGRRKIAFMPSSPMADASDSGVMSIDTVVDAPASSHTFTNPLSSLTGRVTELTRSRMYI